MLTTEQIAEIFEKEFENMPSAGQDTTNALRHINEALDDYCAALTYEAFLWAYALGYEAGKKKKWLKKP